jgi:hypothetical protein
MIFILYLPLVNPLNGKVHPEFTKLIRLFPQYEKINPSCCREKSSVNSPRRMFTALDDITIMPVD